VRAAALAVLMRQPRPGQGKTRLAAQLGVRVAHRLHAAFVADTLGWPLPLPRVLAVAPDAAAAAAVRAWLPGVDVGVQAAGDLGCRIAELLRRAALDARQVVLVGTDSPSLPETLLVECLDMATPAAVAVVPAEDGGFIALSVHRETVARDGLAWLERGIAWSTSRTLADTARMARAAGLEVRHTASWYDVDARGDLPRLHADLQAAPHRAPRTLRCLDALGVAAAAEVAS
jgi:glycosyltransferase A (GT-A) superfamily protein (DUF2064 family)